MKAIAAEVKQLRVIALVAIAAAMATSSACVSGDPLGAAEGTDDWDWGDRFIGEVIEQAEAVGATAEQMAILEEARETGEVSFEVYSEAVDRALRCIREAGGRAIDHGSHVHEGVLHREYSVGGETEAADPVDFFHGMTVHRCIAEHSAYVEMAYQTQPSSVEAQDAFWEQYRDEIVACLRAEGIDISGDEPMSELKGTAVNAYNVDGTAEQDCLAPAYTDENAGG